MTTIAHSEHSSGELEKLYTLSLFITLDKAESSILSPVVDIVTETEPEFIRH